jgi:hypothetical protein
LSASVSPTPIQNQPTSQPKGNGYPAPPNNGTYKVEVEKVPPDYWIRAYVFITALLALINIGIVGLMWQQRKVMESQIAEMKDAGKQTDRLISQAEAQVSALTTAASAALKNAESVEKQLALMSTATAQTEKLIEHAENQTKALIAAAEIALTHSRATASVAEATRLAAEATSKSAEAADITAEFTREAAITAKKSADAARTTAESLINSERPWIVPEISKEVKWIDSFSTDKETLDKAIKRRVVYFTFSITNHGRTPAEIVGIRGNPHLTNKGIHGGLEDPPDYGLQYIFMQVRMLAPGQHWDYDDIDLNFGWADEQTMKEIESFKLHRMFKGVVLYRDVFNPEILHESRFCYTYFAMREDYLPSGPPEHTKYT